MVSDAWKLSILIGAQNTSREICVGLCEHRELALLYICMSAIPT